MLKSRTQKWTGLILGNSIILFLTYHFFLLYSYTSDHISGYLSETQDFKIELWFGARPISTTISYICNLLFGFSIEIQPFMQLTSVFLLALACALVTDLYFRHINKNQFSNMNFQNWLMLIIVNIFVFLSFINPLITETFVYPTLEWNAGILFAIFAARRFIHQKYLSAYFLLIFTIFTYQSYYSIFLCLVFTCFLLELINNSKAWKPFCKKCITALIYVGTGCLLNMLYTKIFLLTGLLKTDVKQTGMASHGITQQILDIVGWICKIFGDAYGALPRWFIVIFMAIIIGITLYLLWQYSACKKTRLWLMIAYFATMGICFFSVFLLSLVQGSGVYLPQRISFPSYFGLTTMFVVAYKLANQGAIKKVLLGICAFVLLVSFACTQISIMDFYTTNTLDRYYMDSVQLAIEKYEKQTGVEIKTVYAGRVDTSAYLYEYLHLPYALESYNHKMPYYNWSDVELLNYFSNENYIDEDMPDEIYKKYFEGKNWDIFVADEQLVFDQDKVYWVIF